MRRIRQIVTAVFIGQCLLVSPHAAQAQNTLLPTMVDISLEKNTLTQREPTIVDITVRNSSADTVDFDPGYDKEGIDIKVTDPKGLVWKKQLPAPHEGMRFSNAVHVEPGSTNVTFLLLNNWFSIDEVGDYQIDVTLYSPNEIPIHRKDGISARLTLDVLSRDDERLESACADLAKRIKSAPSASAALVAAEALSKVDDPIAVPFLVEVLGRRDFTALMIGALAHMKTDAALNALTSAAHSNDQEISSLARSALANRAPHP